MTSDSTQKPETLAALLEQISVHAGAQQFFKQFWQDKDSARLFLAHRDLLFGVTEEDGFRFEFPLLFFDNLPDVLDTERPSEGEQIAADESALRMEKAEIFSDSIGSALWEFIGDAKVGLVLAVLRYLKDHPEKQRLLEAPSFADVKQAEAQRPFELKVFEELNHIGKLLRGKSENLAGDRVLMSSMAKYADKMRAYITGGFQEAFKMLDLGTFTVQFQLIGARTWRKLAKIQGFSRESYKRILNLLYTSRLISNVNTSFWCPRCEDDKFLFQTNSRLSPRHLKTFCPKCRKTTQAATCYAIDSPLMDALTWKDGILPVAIGWLLRENKVAFDAGAYSADNETDILCKNDRGNILVECKMFKTGKDSDSVVNNLKKALQQTQKHAESLKHEGKTLLGALTVVNYELEAHQDEVRRATSAFEEAMQAHSISLVAATGFGKAITGLLRGST